MTDNNVYKFDENLLRRKVKAFARSTKRYTEKIRSLVEPQTYNTESGTIDIDAIRKKIKTFSKRWKHRCKSIAPPLWEMNQMKQQKSQKTKTCNFCGIRKTKYYVKLKLCSACHNVRYCSRHC